MVSTYERVTPIAWDDAPTGYTITYHEIRGYDSPDRWYEVKLDDMRIKPKYSFGDAREAKRAAIAHARTRTWDNEADEHGGDPYPSAVEPSASTRRGQ